MNVTNCSTPEEVSAYYDGLKSSRKRAQLTNRWRAAQRIMRWYESDLEPLVSTYLGVSTGSIELPNRDHGQDVNVKHVGDCNELRNSLSKKFTPFIMTSEPSEGYSKGYPKGHHLKPVNESIRQYDDVRSHSPSGEGSMWYVWDDEAFSAHVSHVLHEGILATERIITHGSRLKPGSWNGWKVNSENPQVANHYQYIPGFVRGWKRDGTFVWPKAYDPSSDKWLKRPWDVPATKKQLRACGSLWGVGVKPETYLGLWVIDPDQFKVNGTKDPINWVKPNDLFRGAPIPKWNEPRMGGYDPGDGEPSLLYRLKHFSKRGVCHWCGKRVRKTGKRTPKYCKPCQEIATKLSKANSKKRISGIRAQVGSVPQNGFNFKHYLTKHSSNPKQLKAVRDEVDWPNYDDLKPKRVKVVSDIRPINIRPDGCELIVVWEQRCVLCGGRMAIYTPQPSYGMHVTAGNPCDTPQQIGYDVLSCTSCGYTVGQGVTGNSEPYDGP